MRKWTLERAYNEKGTADLASGQTSTEIHIDGTPVGLWIDFEEGPHGARAELIVRAVNSHADLLAALDDITNNWADPLGTISVNCGALDRTVALDAALARARAAIARAKGGGE